MDYSGSFLRTFLKVLQVLTEARIGFCVVGGMAVSIVARPRTTQDLDFLVALDPPQRSELKALLAKSFSLVQFKDLPLPSRQAPVWRAVLAVPEYEEGLMIVDFLLADTAQQRSTLERALVVPLGGVQTPVATPEDLILMKSQANRPKDQEDIAAIREAHAGQLDEAYLERWSRELRAPSAERRAGSST